MGYKCLVCFYNDLYDLPYDEDGIASDEICPCCGFQYGYDDFKRDSTVYSEWRIGWMDSGFKWFSKGRKPPKDWNPKEQIENGLNEQE